jgi:hypothetical protein
MDNVNLSEQTEGGPAIVSKPEHVHSHQQAERFDRVIEVIAAIALALATVLTAWCGYQAARWSGAQARAYNEASAARIQAAEKLDGADIRRSTEVGLFVQYAEAIAHDDAKVADFLYERFPPELKTATDAWLATQPLTNPDAPHSPFAMPEYRVPEQAEARQFQQIAAAKFEEASADNELGDRYVLLTVIFATVLFFGGVSGKFRWRVIDGAVLVFGALVLLGGLFVLLQSPVR